MIRSNGPRHCELSFISPLFVKVNINLILRSTTLLLHPKELKIRAVIDQAVEVLKGRCALVLLSVPRLLWFGNTLIYEFLKPIISVQSDILITFPDVGTEEASKLSRNSLSLATWLVSALSSHANSKVKKSLMKLDSPLLQLRQLATLGIERVTIMFPLYVEDLLFATDSSESDASSGYQQSVLYTLTDIQTLPDGPAWQYLIMSSSARASSMNSRKIRSRLQTSVTLNVARSLKAYELQYYLNTCENYAEQLLFKFHGTSEDDVNLRALFERLREAVDVLIYQIPPGLGYSDFKSRSYKELADLYDTRCDTPIQRESVSIGYIMKRIIATYGSFVRTFSAKIEPIDLTTSLLQFRNYDRLTETEPLSPWVADTGTPVRSMCTPIRSMGTPVRRTPTRSMSPLRSGSTACALFRCITQQLVDSSVTPELRVLGFLWGSLSLIDHCCLLAYCSLHLKLKLTCIVCTHLLGISHPSAISGETSYGTWTTPAIQESLRYLLKSQLLVFSYAQINFIPPEEAYINTLKQNNPGLEKWMYYPVIMPYCKEYVSFATTLVRETDLLPKWFRLSDDLNILQ